MPARVNESENEKVLRKSRRRLFTFNSALSTFYAWLRRMQHEEIEKIMRTKASLKCFRRRVLSYLRPLRPGSGRSDEGLVSGTDSAEFIPARAAMSDCKLGGPVPRVAKRCLQSKGHSYDRAPGARNSALISEWDPATD
jgi:hypothetical protein